VSLFVTVEGIEGSGKSTLVRTLADRLARHGIDALTTREPGDTALGRSIRAALLDVTSEPPTPIAELLLYLADRHQHVTHVIRPALAAGRIVLCDRFSDSTIAYQGYGRGLDLATVAMLDRVARDEITPDLTIVLDCPPDVGLARAHARTGSRDRLEREPLAFHERVRAGFHTLAAADPSRHVVIDTTAERETVAALAEREILARRRSP
jgi:dTMP kinase